MTPSAAALGALAILTATAGAVLVTRAMRTLAGRSQPRLPGDDAPDRIAELAALAIALSGWPLAYGALQALVPATPGAVCILGVVQAGGIPARFMEAAFPIAAAVALGAALCRRGGAAPRAQAWWAAAQGGATLACAIATVAFLTRGPAPVPVDCCSFLDPGAAPSSLGLESADGGLAFFHVAVAFCTAALLRAGFYPWGPRTSVSLGASGALSAFAVLHDAGNAWGHRLLGRPHPCVYDLLAERPGTGPALMLLAGASALALLAMPIERTIPSSVERTVAPACRIAAIAAMTGLLVLWFHAWTTASR